MQILFAAPFLLVAGILFIVLSSFKTTRRWAIVAPAGTLASAPGAILGLAIAALFGYSVLGYQGPARWWYGLICLICGLASAYLFAKFIGSLAPMLPKILFRLAVAGSAFCSHFVVLFFANLALNERFHYADARLSIAINIAILLVSSWAAWYWFTVADSSSMLPRQKSTDPSIDTLQNT